jgi:PII-like signaling protein
VRNLHKTLVEKLEDEGLAGRIILKCILRNKVGSSGVEVFSLGQVMVAETF